MMCQAPSAKIWRTYSVELVIGMVGLVMIISLPNSIPTPKLKMIWVFCWRLALWYRNWRRLSHLGCHCGRKVEFEMPGSTAGLDLFESRLGNASKYYHWHVVQDLQADVVIHV